MEQPCEDNILGDEVQNGPIRRKRRKPAFLFREHFPFEHWGWKVVFENNNNNNKINDIK